MADAKFKISISARDQASRALNKVKHAVTGMIGAWLAYRGVQAITGLVGDMIRLAGEQETAVARVEAALKSTGNAVGMTIDELSAMANQMQRTTSLSDDQVLSAQALGLTYTSIGKEIFPDFIKAAADMSQAMGVDMRSSILQLGKAIQDPDRGVAALARVGVNTYELQAKMTDAMPIMEKQKLIIEEINTEFGGMAEAMGATLQGNITRFKNDIGDLQEGIGNAIVKSEAWRTMIRFISNEIYNLTKWLAANEDEVKEWGNNFAFTVVNTTRTVVDTLADLATAYSAVMIPILEFFKITAYLSGSAWLDIRNSLDATIESLDKFGVGAQTTKLKLDALAELLEAKMRAAVFKAKEEVDKAAGAFKDLETNVAGAGKVISLLPELVAPIKEFRTFVDEYMIAPIKDVQLATDEMGVAHLIAFEKMRQAMHSFTQSWASSVLDSIWAGEANFAQFVGSFISGMTKMIAKMIVFKAISAAFGMPTGIPFFGAAGGVVPRKFQSGGVVPGGAPYTDRVASWLTPAEGVVNLLGMRTLGREGLNALNRGNTFHNAIDFHINLGAGSGLEQGEQVVAILEQEFPRIYHDAIQGRKI